MGNLEDPLGVEFGVAHISSVFKEDATASTRRRNEISLFLGRLDSLMEGNSGFFDACSSIVSRRKDLEGEDFSCFFSGTDRVKA